MIGVNVGDEVLAGKVRGRVVEVGWLLVTVITIDLGSGCARPVYIHTGGVLARCVDSADCSFVASIGWTHPDTAVSIRRGVVVAAQPVRALATEVR